MISITLDHLTILTGCSFRCFQRSRHNILFLARIEFRVGGILEMANKAGYQRNESKLHHAKSLTVGAEEKNLFFVSRAALYPNVASSRVWYFWLEQGAFEENESLPLEFVYELPERNAKVVICLPCLVLE